MASTDNGADLGIEASLFKTADKLRGNMEPSDYKHVALRLIFLKHISDGFELKRQALLEEYPRVPKILMNIWPTISFGFRAMHAGRIYRPVPGNRPSAA